MEIIKGILIAFIGITKMFFEMIVTLIRTPFGAAIVIALISTTIIKIVYKNVLFPWLKGCVGEFRVSRKLRKLPKEKYRVLNNIMVSQNETTHQIDHLIISQFGIFIIEVKNYAGVITGSDYDDKWVQHLGKNKSYFPNPIWQNYGHVKALEELLNLENNVFIPIVCFTDSEKLKIQAKNNVVSLGYLIPNIKSYQNVVIENDLDIIYNRIIELNIVDRRERVQHNKKIKDKISEDEEKVKNMICPRCGNSLVVRNSGHGPFIACSNYPKCKFINRGR